MQDTRSTGRILVIELKKDLPVLKGLSSEIRLSILELLRERDMNVGEIAAVLKLPQSTVATNIIALEKVGLIATNSRKASKGNQKVCSPIYEEFVVKFPEREKEENDVFEVEMPVGLFIQYEVSSPCGMCSSEKIIGYLDSPSSFLEPERVKAGLLWFEKGFVEYQFPNDALAKNRAPQKLEIIMELSSEVPGTNPKWLSDITLWLNGIEIGTWTSPGDFGDVRGKFTPAWWKLAGSQYGLLKNWGITEAGTFVDGTKVSPVTLTDLDIRGHTSLKVRIGIKEDAANVGGVNIFGEGFGNYGQDIVMKMYLQ